MLQGRYNIAYVSKTASMSMHTFFQVTLKIKLNAESKSCKKCEKKYSQTLQKTSEMLLSNCFQLTFTG